MNQEKTIETLRKRNKQLQEENEQLKKQNEQLKKQLDNIQMINDRVSLELERIEALKTDWMKQLGDIKEQRKKYAEIMSDLEKLKKVKNAIVE